MATPWTTEQVAGLAPDAASLGAGRKLASAAKWQTLGQTDRLIWGEIKGSGSKPYQTCIDTVGPAFKCSCPSRKFPCKHGLGLAFVHADSSPAFASGAPPDWVADWHARREERAERQATRTAAQAEPVDAQTQQRRAAAQEKRRGQRQDKMQAGVAELRRWLADCLRQGLARALENNQPWDQMTSRLVDAQAPGLARWLRRCQEARFSSEQWHGAALRTLARLQLILDAYEGRDRLPDPIQDDLLDLLGVPRSKEDLLALPGVSDTWRVMGQWVSQEERLQVQRTWLWGERERRWALLLDFAADTGVLPLRPEEGAAIEGSLVFYPGTWPMRALLKEPPAKPTSDVPASTGPCLPIAGLYQVYADQLARTPWLERFPAGLDAVVPCQAGGDWMLIDAAGHQIPLVRQFPFHWELLAISGGEPIQVFGEWDGACFLPLTTLSGERFQGLQAQRVELD